MISSPSFQSSPLSTMFNPSVVLEVRTISSGVALMSRAACSLAFTMWSLPAANTSRVVGPSKLSYSMHSMTASTTPLGEGPCHPVLR